MHAKRYSLEFRSLSLDWGALQCLSGRRVVRLKWDNWTKNKKKCWVASRAMIPPRGLAPSSLLYIVFFSSADENIEFTVLSNLGHKNLLYIVHSLFLPVQHKMLKCCSPAMNILHQR